MSNKKVVLTIDVLINNASRFRYGFIGELTPEDWDFTVRNVLYSCFNFSNEVSKVFKKNRSGKIINIGSINGLRGREGNLAYSSAKAGMIGLTKSIAKELGPIVRAYRSCKSGFVFGKRSSKQYYWSGLSNRLQPIYLG